MTADRSNFNKVLACNAGSSSLKLSLFQVDSDATAAAGSGMNLLATGEVSQIGQHAQVRLEASGETLSTAAWPDVASGGAGHSAAVDILLDGLVQVGLLGSHDHLVVGHRVVHGGPRSAHSIIDQDVLGDIAEYCDLAPLHNPPALAVIEATRQRFGSQTPMVATFDTAMFAEIPDKASGYAIPLRLSERHQIRRYGFHGLAHTHMAESAANLLGQELDQLRLITLQLGNGCSAAAIANGAAIDTSMGMTPIEGLMMGTRSGDIDPAVVALLAEREGLGIAEVLALLNQESGLLGVSGMTSDMMDLATAENEGHPGATLAREMFVYRIIKYVGSYAAALGGVDALVFGGGIGEGAADLRDRICANLGFLGLSVDQEINNRPSKADREIGCNGQSAKVVVVAVDEMAIIARETLRCLAE